LRIAANITALQRNRWYEYVVRFAAGGAVTVIAGLIARKYGPGIGGLFLAFPAIFPAAATLLASHEERKRSVSGKTRGRKLAAVDAFGAALGGFGLMAFAAVVMLLIPAHSTFLTLAGATAAWSVASLSLWLARESVWRSVRRGLFKSHKYHGEANKLRADTHRRSS